MIFYLPTIYSRKEGYECLAALVKATDKLKSGRLELDFSRVGFFDANMAAPLGSVLARVTDNFNAVEIVNVPEIIERVLRRNEFLTNFGYPAWDGPSSNTSMPYIRLQLTGKNSFEPYLQRHLKGKGLPQMTEGLGKTFKQKIYEVYQNSVIHSESQLGIFVCGQFFPQQQRLDLTIADAGIGIRDSVRRRFNTTKIASVEAILWAIEEGNTTKQGSQPGGLGLKFLHDFARRNHGRIQIVSRLGYYEFVGGKGAYAKLSGDYPGTAVTIEVNTADTTSYGLSTEVSCENLF